MSKDGSNVFARGEEFLKAFNKGLEFTKELIAENERLRRTLMQREVDQTAAAQNPDDWEKLRTELVEQIQDLQAERDTALEQLREIEQENQHFAQRHVEIGRRTTRLPTCTSRASSSTRRSIWQRC